MFSDEQDIKNLADGDVQPRSPLDAAPVPSNVTLEKIDRAFELLYHATQRNRFLLTIVCAAASEQGWMGASKSRPVRYHADRVLEWLVALIADLSPLLPSDRSDMTIARVLDAFRAGHEHGRQVPCFFAVSDEKSSFRKAVKALALQANAMMGTKLEANEIAACVQETLCSPLGWRLQERLLWHLAVMGLSTQSDVLSMAPLVHEDCRHIAVRILRREKNPVTDEELHEAIVPALVEVALDLLVHRCLVFRQSPVCLGPEEVQQLWSTIDDEGPTLSYDEWLAAGRPEKLRKTPSPNASYSTRAGASRFTASCSGRSLNTSTLRPLN